VTKIAIRVQPPVGPRELMVLKGVLDRSLGELRRCIDSELPIVELTLFMNDHEEAAERMKKLVALARGPGAMSMEFFELEDEEVLSPANADLTELAAQAALNILEMHARLGRSDG